MAAIKWVLATDIDGTLVGHGGERELAHFLSHHPEIGVVYLTGRTRANAEPMIRHHGYPEPVALATDIGADIHWGTDLKIDETWAFEQRREWSPRRAQQLMEKIDGLQFLGRSSHWRLAFLADSDEVLARARTRLVQEGVPARTLWDAQERRIDVVPRGAFKGRALKYILSGLNVRAQQCFVAGDAENDSDILQGRYRGVLVANATLSLKDSLPSVILRSPYEGAYGVLHGLRQFLHEPLTSLDQEDAG